METKPQLYIPLKEGILGSPLFPSSNISPVLPLLKINGKLVVSEWILGSRVFRNQSSTVKIREGKGGEMDFKN